LILINGFNSYGMIFNDFIDWDKMLMIWLNE